MNSSQGKQHVSKEVVRPKRSLKHKLAWLSDHCRNEWRLYVMLLPTVIWCLVFLYKPMYGLQIAFKDYSIFRGVAASPWVGWEHFDTLFSNDQFIRAFWNTIKISALNLLFGFPAPIILALMFNEVLHATYKRFSQTIVYLPHFISFHFISFHQSLSLASSLPHFHLPLVSSTQ
jgi:putative aldouronate transport system permease protein